MVASSTISFPVGLVGTPGLFFTGDANTGIWQATADTLSFTGGGTNLMTLSSTQLATATTMKIVSGSGGTAALPAYTFFGDTNTGMSAETADTLVLSTSGTAKLTITTVLTSGVAFRGADGSANTPMYSFTDDTNTGIYAESGYCKVTHNGTGWSVGYLELPINTINGSETLTLPDSGKCIHKASGGAGETITIPANASVAYPTGTAITFVNTGGGDLSIAINSDTLTMAGTGDTGTRTLASPGVATAIKLTSTTWLISGTGLS